MLIHEQTQRWIIGARVSKTIVSRQRVGCQSRLTCLNTWGELEELKELDAQAGLCYINSTQPLHRHALLESLFSNN
jgi:hypothetical protein